jgi:hypothetical protein
MEYKIFIDSLGELYCNDTCDVTGMTECQMKPDGTPYIAYNLDGTPDLAAQDAAEVEFEIMVKKKYLESTDWYFIRQLEEGIAIPEDIATARAEAKAYIRDNES